LRCLCVRFVCLFVCVCVCVDRKIGITLPFQKKCISNALRLKYAHKLNHQVN
jgi:hypothetical protein